MPRVVGAVLLLWAVSAPYYPYLAGSVWVWENLPYLLWAAVPVTWLVLRLELEWSKSTYRIDPDPDATAKRQGLSPFEVEALGVKPATPNGAFAAGMWDLAERGAITLYRDQEVGWCIRWEKREVTLAPHEKVVVEGFFNHFGLESWAPEKLTPKDHLWWCSSDEQRFRVMSWLRDHPGTVPLILAKDVYYNVVGWFIHKVVGADGRRVRHVTRSRFLEYQFDVWEATDRDLALSGLVLAGVAKFQRQLRLYVALVGVIGLTFPFGLDDIYAGSPWKVLSGGGVALIVAAVVSWLLLSRPELRLTRAGMKVIQVFRDRRRAVQANPAGPWSAAERIMFGVPGSEEEASWLAACRGLGEALHWTEFEDAPLMWPDEVRTRAGAAG